MIRVPNIGRCPQRYASSLIQDNLFEWHFTLRGPKDTVFEEGLYHGKILLPTEYPFRPPDVLFLTPNGRWEVNQKVCLLLLTRICLTFTGFHEETWQPAWGIRTALLSVQSLMSSKDEAGVGAVSMTAEDRENLAKQYVYDTHRQIKSMDLLALCM